MLYRSTSGRAARASLGEAVWRGLAPDGGLYQPEEIPRLEPDFWSGLPGRDLAETAVGLLGPFVEAELAETALRQLVLEAFDFSIPLVRLEENTWLLELFHGPTLAFKDIGARFLARLQAALRSRGAAPITVLVATSGDTGGAVAQAFHGLSGFRVVVLYPIGRVSRRQESQFATLGGNVRAVAVEGTFDDCQSIMKEIFGDLEFKDKCALGTINSINWARVLAQIVYYFYSAFRLIEKTGAEKVRFSVPTGNFGDVFAGYIATMMGLPASKLIVATNENDILSRFFRSGLYEMGEVHKTLSPSMDIQVASNFARYLYYTCGQDPVKLSELMKTFSTTGKLKLGNGEAPDKLFTSGTGTTPSTLSTIKKCFENHSYLIDPHTAVGVHIGLQNLDPNEPVVCLATAHPSKFPDAIQTAFEGSSNVEKALEMARHPSIEALNNLPSQQDILPSDINRVKEYLSKRI